MDKVIYVGEIERTPFSPDHKGIKQGLENYHGLIVDPIINDI